MVAASSSLILMTKTIDITELILRDAHQSLMATRMAMEDMVPACEDLDKAGYWSVECWGGATFDSCIRFLNEDPWERLRTFRKLMPNTRLQMLLRGQNLLGYRHYEDTVVDRFVEKAADNGMDVFRVFDALNDIRNVRRAIAAVKTYRQARAGDDLLHDQPAAHGRRTSSRWRSSCVELGCDSHLHQGHGGAAEAAARLRHREAASRRRAARTSGSTCTCTRRRA